MRSLKWLSVPVVVMVAFSATAWAADNGSGGASSQRSMTGPGGQTWSSNSSGSYGNGSASGSRTVTAPNGQTATRNSNGTYGGGSATVNRSTTGPNGQSFNSSRSGQRR